MDYGKLAYIKAEELEKRITKESDGRVICTDYTLNPTYDFTTNRPCPVCVVRASGTLTLTLLLTLHGSGGTGEIKVYLGDKVLITKSVGTAPSQTLNLTLMRAFYLNGSEVLSIGGGGAMTQLDSVQVVVSGDNADLITNLSSSAVALNGKVWGLISSENDRVRMYPFSENEFNLSTQIFVGSGKCADICANNGYWVACFIDDAGNTTVTMILMTNATANTKVVGDGASDCAITNYYDEYILCEIVDGKLYARKLNEQLTPSARVEVSLPFTPEEICFVKGAISPMLVVYSGGKSYLKVFPPKTEKYDSVSVSVKLTINA